MLRDSYRCFFFICPELDLQIALHLAGALAQPVAHLGKAEQQGHQEAAGDENHPPGVGHQRPLCQGQHTAPGDGFQRQTHAQEAQGGLAGNGRADIHHHHKHNGGEEVGGQMLPQDVQEAAPHGLGGHHILTGPELPHLGAHHLGDGVPAGDADDNGYGDRAGLPPDGL